MYGRLVEMLKVFKIYAKIQLFYSVLIIYFFFIGAGYEIGSDEVVGGGHAWNGILYEGEYLLIDSTWGAGHVNNQQFTKSFNPFYFMCSPMKMIFRHFPKDPEQQYLQPTISYEEFINLPYVRESYFLNGINLIKWPVIAETSKDKITLEFEHTMIDEKIGIYYKANLIGKGKIYQLMEEYYRVLCNLLSNGSGFLNISYFLMEKTRYMISFHN